MLAATYLLPIRSAAPPTEELTAYLRGISSLVPVVVVDGSAPAIFAAGHRAWCSFATHVPPAPDVRCANGKVRGVLTGLRYVRTDAVVIADDDVRYSGAALTDVVGALADADLVRPQNHFDPLPWHAVWDTGRILLNRVMGGDFPGTLAVRTEILRRSDGYDGDVLFENLELMRTVAATGGSCLDRRDLYVRRVPPTLRHFVGQRVRQAYDELARPRRLVAQLAVLPVVIVVGVASRRMLLAAALVPIALAEVGRRRDGGRAVFPARASLAAPGWLLERGVCAWLACACRLRGGVRYGEGRLSRAANDERTIAARLTVAADLARAG